MKYIFCFLFSETSNGVPINSIDEPIIITNNGSPESTTIEYTILHLHYYIYYINIT